MNNKFNYREMVIYQIYPRSFFDANNDGIGDLKGINKKIDYIANLGVDAIWLSPFFKSPMKDFGYDISDYYQVDPIFGSIEDFKILLDTAHSMGLKVIIDQVYSHTSNLHEWFKESSSSKDNPKSDWYVWAEPKTDGSVPNNWQSIFGGVAWQWNSVRKQYYLHNFLVEQPDLNFHNSEVQDAILNVAKFWFDLGVDGFRLDVVNFFFHDKMLNDNPPDPNNSDALRPYDRQVNIYNKTQVENLKFLQKLRKLASSYESEKILLGEMGDEYGKIINYTQNNDKLHLGYFFELLEDWKGVTYIKDTINKYESLLKDGWVCFSFSNHDVMRVASRWGKFLKAPPAKISPLLIHLLVSLKGTPCIYQGEELGLEQAEVSFENLQDPEGIEFWPEHKGRDGCRTPIVWQHDKINGGFNQGQKTWLPIDKKHLPSAVDIQEKTENSILNHVRKILKFRKSNLALKEGTIEFVEINDDNVLAFKRCSAQQELMCIFNFNDKKVNIDFSKYKNFKIIFSLNQNYIAIENDKLLLEEFASVVFEI